MHPTRRMPFARPEMSEATGRASTGRTSPYAGEVLENNAFYRTVFGKKIQQSCTNHAAEFTVVSSSHIIIAD